jgi:hypothetical protein
MANSNMGANQRPAAQQRPAPRPGVNARPGSAFKSGWGSRILTFAILATIAGIALYLGEDEDSALPEDAGYLIAGVCLLFYIFAFVQQARAKFVLFSDRLEAYGIRGKLWDVQLSHIEGIRYDPTQGNFPVGRGIVIFDRQNRTLVVPRSIADVKGLAARLTEAHSQAVLPDILLRLEGSDDIRFGDSITVNRDMIIAPDPATGQPVQFGLRDFQQAFMNKGVLTINMIGKQQPLTLKIAEVLNAHFLSTVIMKAKALGPRVEVVIPIAHDALERTEAMDKLVVTGENKPVSDD